MEFQEYNGWVNFPSWDVFTVMTSYYETYQAIERAAEKGQLQEVERFVTGIVDKWRQNQYTPHAEAAKIQVMDFLMNSVRRVEWTPVYDTLRGERKELGQADELTTIAYTLLQASDWRSVVEGAEYLTEADDRLRGWLEDHCITWVNSPDARRHKGKITEFADTVLRIYFAAVNWQDVTDALKGE